MSRRTVVQKQESSSEKYFRGEIARRYRETTCTGQAKNISQ